MAEASFTILAVDDSEDLLALIEATLRKEFRVRTAPDARAGTRLAFEAPRPDLILLDVDMPGRSGYDMCRALKAAPALADIPVVFLTSRADPADIVQGFQLGAIDYVLKPISREALLARVRTHAELIAHRKEQEALVRQRTAQLEQTRLQLIRRLGRAMEYHETSAVGNRVVRLAHYARALAVAAGARPEMGELMMKAAPLHDIGKVGVPAQVLRKATTLDAPEREQMQRHPEIGAEIIGEHEDPLLKLARTLALTHHERWDGGGYPAKLKGADIPWAGRVMAIVDSFESMTATQFHREPMPFDRAVKEIESGAGRQYDPAMVEAFRKALPEFRTIHQTYRDQLGDLLDLDFSAAPPVTTSAAPAAAATPAPRPPAPVPASPPSSLEAELKRELAQVDALRKSVEQSAATQESAQARARREEQLAEAALEKHSLNEEARKRAAEAAAAEARAAEAAKKRVAAVQAERQSAQARAQAEQAAAQAAAARQAAEAEASTLERELAALKATTQDSVDLKNAADGRAAAARESQAAARQKAAAIQAERAAAEARVRAEQEALAAEADAKQAAADLEREQAALRQAEQALAEVEARRREALEKEQSVRKATEETARLRREALEDAQRKANEEARALAEVTQAREAAERALEEARAKKQEVQALTVREHEMRAAAEARIEREKQAATEVQARIAAENEQARAAAARAASERRATEAAELRAEKERALQQAAEAKVRAEQEAREAAERREKAEAFAATAEQARAATEAELAKAAAARREDEKRRSKPRPPAQAPAGPAASEPPLANPPEGTARVVRRGIPAWLGLLLAAATGLGGYYWAGPDSLPAATPARPATVAATTTVSAPISHASGNGARVAHGCRVRPPPRGRAKITR